jgi:hypothetical protein
VDWIRLAGIGTSGGGILLKTAWGKKTGFIKADNFLATFSRPAFRVHFFFYETLFAQWDESIETAELLLLVRHFNTTVGVF